MLPSPDGTLRAPFSRSGRLLGGIETVLGVICAIILASLLAVTLGSAVLRYAFGIGFSGTEELAIWLHVALVACGAPLAFDGVLAMRLDVLVCRLPPLWRAVADSIADVFVVLAALVFCSGGASVVTGLGGISPTLGVPEWIRFAVFSLGGALVLVVLALRRYVSGRRVSLVVALVSGGCLYTILPFLTVDVGWPPSAVMGALALLGMICAAPLAYAFLAAAYVAIAFGSTQPEAAIVATTVAGISKFLLLAIPFFLLSGSLLEVSGIARRLVRFAETLVGHRRSGLAQTILLSNVLFSGASGSSIAGAAFGARTFYPALTAHGYPPAQVGAIIASCSVLENVIPPSVAFLILAVATNLSVGSLLVGGAVAGIVMALCLATAIGLSVREERPRAPAGWGEVGRSAIGALPAFGLGIVVVVGIRIGIVTTTEAAALAALYTLVLCAAGGIRSGTLWSTFRRTAGEAAAISLLIGTAAPFAFLLAVDDVSGVIASVVDTLDAGVVGVLLMTNLILLLAGLVLDIGAAILLFAPILVPVAVEAGIDPIHFGVILVVNLMLGGLTPPVGILVYVVAGLTQVPAAVVFRAALPYVAALLGALVLLGAGALTWSFIFFC